MEFHEKLQKLRKQKSLTQEELAEALYVSRAAVSKWESGRGYPNIDSLKTMAKFFGVTVDELLSGEQLLAVAEDDHKQKQSHFRDLVFGLLDISTALLFLLPFFGQKSHDQVQAVSLLALGEIAPYLKPAYFAAVLGCITWGILTLALQNCQKAIWAKSKGKISLILSAAGTLLFMVSLQPYAAAFLFIYLLIKTLTLIKWQ